MITLEKPNTKGERGKEQIKNHKNEPDSEEPAEDEYTYCVNRQNLGATVNDLVSDSELLLEQFRKGQITSKNNNSISTKHECNVLFIFLTLQNTQNLKIVITRQS